MKRFILTVILALGTCQCQAATVAENVPFKLPLSDGTTVSAVCVPGYIIYALDGDLVILATPTLAIGPVTVTPPKPAPVVVTPPAPGTHKVFGVAFGPFTPAQLAAVNNPAVTKAFGGRFKVVVDINTASVEVKSFADAAKTTAKPCIVTTDEEGNILLNQPLPADVTVGNITILAK